MSLQRKKVLADKNSIPGEPKSFDSSGRLPNLKKGDLLTNVTNKELQQLLGKGKYPSALDFSGSHFALENDQFLNACRDVVRDLCLSSNPVKEIASVDHLSKLKVLVADNCRLQKVSLNKLESLETLSLRDSQLTSVPKLHNLQKLVNLNLSGNPLSVGFEELESLKSLQVLDLARTGLDMNIQQFYQFVLGSVKKLPKLSHISFAENPVEVSIIKFRLFVISELNKIKYVDWVPVTREEKNEYPRAEALWKDKSLPAAALKTPVLVSRSTRMGAGRSQANSTQADNKSNVLGDDDKHLVNFLLGDSAADNNGVPMKSKDSALDDFLHETTADPLNDILNYLAPEENKAAAAGSNAGGGDGDDYEDELMRIIYGDSKPPATDANAAAAAAEDDDIFNTINADLDAVLGQPQEQAPAAPKKEEQKAASVADADLDDLLDSIIAVEGGKAAASATSNEAISAIDQLLVQEQGAKEKRLEEEKQRVEEEKKRLEAARIEMEKEKERELEREKARLRVEMEAAKQREIDAVRNESKNQNSGNNNNTTALEDEAMAMLEMMDDFIEENTGGGAPSSTPAPGSTTSAADDADALLASIDALVGVEEPAQKAAPAARPFGPRSSVAAAKPKAPVVKGALPIARRRRADSDDDDELNSLLSEAGAGKPTLVAPSWLSYWSQLRFGDRLGVGTFGVTSVGWSKSSEVAVKKLKLQRFNDDFLNKFKEEVPKMVELNHPNLVRFIGVVADNNLCTLHAYVRGCNLWGYLRNEGNQVDLAFITRISRGVAQGISYLHAKKLFHRNLHSKNILLDGEMIPRLRDYGLQYIKQETYKLANGPIAYEAPELLARKEYNETVDAYSFGMLLWELFCREDPYKGMMPLAIKEQVLASELRPDVTPDIPVVFRRLMGACWNTDPARRPTFVVIGKILNKPPNELGSYGTSGEGATATTLFAAPKLQGPAAMQQQASGGPAPAVDLVAQLNAPEQSTSMNALMGKISKLLQSNDRLTQQRGLRVVYNLFQKKEYSDQMHLMKGLIPMLIERAKLGNEKGTRDLSLQALGKMCVDAVCAEEFLENLGWPTLIQALDSMDTALELSSTKLMVILLKNPRNNDAFVSVRAVPVLVKLLFSDTDMVKTNAVWATSLALENEQTQDEFVAEGGVPILLRLAQSTSPGVVLRVLVSVGLLLTNKAVFDELKDSGVIQRFLKLLSSPSPLLQKHGIEAIARFCGMPELREALYNADGISCVLELLNLTQDPKIKVIAVSSLCLYLDDDDHAMYIEQSQALRPVVRLMVSQDPELRLEALRMISKAASHPDLQPQLLSIGAISPLVQLLNAKDKNLRMTALYSICVATSDDQIAAAVAQADGGAQLVRLCGLYGDDETLELAAETFANIAHSTTGIAQLRECGAFPFLVGLLSHENPAVVEGVANALVHASSLPEGRVTLVALDAVVPLLRLTNSDDEGLRESVLWSTPNWCSDGTTAEIVVRTALPAIVDGLNDPKENIQSICVKAILLLAASSDFKSQLKSAGAEAALKRLEAGSANKTLGLAAQKALSLL